MLHIYTEEFLLEGRIKRFIKKVLGRNFGGPKAVEESLVLGLLGMKYPFKLNTSPAGKDNIAIVLNGTRALKKVISLKSKGYFKTLLAGPNLVVLPRQENAVLTSKEINKVIVPSEWVAEMYIKDIPELKNKLAVWPAGVFVPELVAEEKTIDFLIFNKLQDESFAGEIKKALPEYKVNAINYGQFNQKKYFELLEKSRFLVYLSISESQGLAMFEAWARNVPTLVWERGFAESENLKVFGKTSAPYLNPELGLSFSTLEEFKIVLAELPSKAFHSKEFVVNHFTHKICAKNLINLATYNA